MLQAGLVCERMRIKMFHDAKSLTTHLVLCLEQDRRDVGSGCGMWAATVSPIGESRESELAYLYPCGSWR